MALAMWGAAKRAGASSLPAPALRRHSRRRWRVAAEFLCKKIYQRADLGRKEFPRRIHGIEAELDALVLPQDFDQIAVLEILRDHEGRLQDDPTAGQRGRAACIAVVRAHYRICRHLMRNAVELELPYVASRQVREASW